MRRRAAVGRGLAALALALVSLLGVPAVVAGDPPPSQHDPAAVRRLADDILERAEFRPQGRSLVDRIADWIADHLIPGDSGGGGGSGSGAAASGGGGSSVFTAILLVLAVVGIGYAAWALLRQPRRRRSSDDDAPSIEVEAHRTAREWAEVAARHEAAGEWKDGLRCRFRALVERLTDGGVVPEVAGRTSGELRVDVGATIPEAAGEFDRAAELFERAWYGDVATGPDEAQRFAEHAGRVLDRVGDRQ